MKKFYSLVISLVLLASLGMAQKAPTGDIHLHMLTTGQPAATKFLGDQLNSSGSWYVNFEVGQAAWYQSDAGIGYSNTDPSGWDWRTANWYANGSGSNKQVRSDFGDFRFTQTGNWYFAGRAKGEASDPFHYANTDVWGNNSTFAPIYYFTVNALNNPSSQTATRNATNPKTEIDLSWAKDAENHNVMIVRKKVGESWTEPTQGTAYTVGASIGTGVVVYNDAGISYTNTGLNPATGYEYKFYSENFSYYSLGVTTAALYTAMETYTVGGGGAYCTGGTGVNITLSDSDLGVSYQLLKGGVAAGAPILGTGNALTFSNVTEAGSYTIEATQNSETLLMSGSVDVSVNPVPAAVSVSGGGVHCSSTTLEATGGSGGTIYFQGVTSNGTSTANSNTSVVVSTSNIYYFRSVSNEGCWGEQGVAVVDIDFASPPAAGAITGSNSVNQGQSTVSYSIEALQYATSYIWSYSGTGATITGTGNNVTISFSNSATSGDLTVSGHNSCGDGLVSAGFTITVSPASNPPTAFNITGTGSYCATGDGLEVGLDGSEIGVTYTLIKDGTATETTVAGDGSAISFETQPAGTYTVSGTSSGGTTPMTGSAIITAVAAPTASAGASQFVTIGIPYTINGATASNYTTISWAKTGGSGNGTFDPVDELETELSGTTAGPMNITLTASNAFCPAATSTVTYYIIGVDPIQWTGATSDWHDPNNWFPQMVPTADISAVIPNTGIANFPVVSSAATCKNLTLASGASILDNGNLNVTGTANVEVTITAGKYHSFSPSVTGAVAGLFLAPGTTVYLFGHDETQNAAMNGSVPTGGYTGISSVSASLSPMTGYAVYSTANHTFTQTGDDINTGTFTKSLTRTGSGNYAGYNYVGNPYPSYIDWAASTGWTKTGISNTTYIENNGNWAVYPYSGGTGLNEGSRYIAPGQGFFVLATSSSASLSMTNAVRTNTTTAYLKSSPTNIVRLVASGNNRTDETAIRFDSEATAQFDAATDAPKLAANDTEYPQIYSVADKNLAFNTLPETEMVQLGFKAEISGSYSIGMNYVADLQYVTLEDTKTGIFTELSKSAYTFDYSTGENELRFKLHFSALSVDETKTKAAHIYSYQKTVYVNIAEQTEGDIYIYNIAGQLVASKPSARGMNEIGVQVTGNYIVKVITKGSTVVEKVFVQ